MRSTVIIALIFTVIQINVHATLAMKTQDSPTIDMARLVLDKTGTVEWMPDANLVTTLCKSGHPLLSSFDPSLVANGTGRNMAEICSQEGRMNWYEAKAWIRHLNQNAYLGYTNWRLPEISPRDSSCSELAELDNTTVTFGFGCRNGEPGRLHAVLGSNIGRLTNLDEGMYWSETVLAEDDSLAGVFDVKTNWQDAEGKTSDLLHVWPVRSL